MFAQKEPETENKPCNLTQRVTLVPPRPPDPVCVRARVCVCVRACVCVRVCVCARVRVCEGGAEGWVIELSGAGQMMRVRTGLSLIRIYHRSHLFIHRLAIHLSSHLYIRPHILSIIHRSTHPSILPSIKPCSFIHLSLHHSFYQWLSHHSNVIIILNIQSKPIV